MTKRPLRLGSAASVIGLAVGAAAIYTDAIRPWHLRRGTLRWHENAAAASSNP